MKTKLLFIIILFAGFCNAQIVNIPDAEFKTRLITASSSNQIAKDLNGNFFKIDANNDGQIQLSEATKVSYINCDKYVPFGVVYSLEGLLSFSNIKTFICSGPYQDTTVDLSSLVHLEELRLDALQSDSGPSLLANLNLTGLANLKNLFLRRHENLDVIDFSTLPNLETLYIEGCINQINLINQTNLVNLTLTENFFNNLNFLNVPSLVNLKTLNLENFLDNINPNFNYSWNFSNHAYLEELYISRNPFINIDISQNLLLKTLGSERTKLSSLDLSKHLNLIELFCRDNINLTTINIKNGINLISDAGYLFIWNPNLKYICADDTEANLILNNQYYNSNIVVNSYCSFTPGGTFYNITGNQKFDFNNNGCDDNDIIYPNFKCSITNGTDTGVFISNNSGSYTIPVQAGNHTITPILENPTYFNVNPSTFNVSFPTSPSPYSQNFCINANGNHNDLEISLLPVDAARPGFDARYKIIYKNKGTTAQSGFVNLNFNDEVSDFVLSNPTISIQSTGNLTWNFSNLLPFETREIDLVFNLNSLTETPPLNSGDLLKYTATITDQADEIPNDNTFTLNQTVVNSYDPNDKTCLEGVKITPNLVGEYVHYLIRFENNGTANAQNIVVKDLVDANKFDINTLIPIKASHTFETKISNTNKVEFIFQNINLPFDDANNDGYVLFKIKTKPNLVIGDSFSNLADIYFDYNFPIVTNNYTTTVQNALGTNENKIIKNLLVYPNPVKDILHIKTKDNVLKIEIFDYAGRKLSSNSVKKNNVNVSELKSGNYLIKIYTAKGITSEKIIKN